MAIDVGHICEILENTNDNATYVGKENPANADGDIDYICIWGTASPITDAEVASFIDEGSDVLSTRIGGVSGNLGNLSGGENPFTAEGDFTSFSIETNDYIGITGSSGTHYRESSSGSGYWHKSGDYIPASSESFTSFTPRTISVYATGPEAGGYQEAIEGSMPGSSGVLTRKVFANRPLVGSV